MSTVRVCVLTSPPTRHALFREHLLTPVPNAAARQIVVFIARVVGSAGTGGSASFAELDAVSSDSVARLAKRVCTEFPHWKVAADEVELFLVAPPAGVDEPSADAIKDALSGTRLQAGWPLEHARIGPGSWLLARVPPPPTAAPGASHDDDEPSQSLFLSHVTLTTTPPPPSTRPHVFHNCRRGGRKCF